MEILSFDIVGKFAHFRKYYTTNTALSFTIPPRTAIMGIVGAVLGKQRDSYYEEFASDKLRIGIQVKSRIKKSMHRVNYLSIKGKDDFRGKQSHIQTPVELLSGEKIGRGEVRYKLYVSYFEGYKEIYDRIKETLLNSRIHYNLTLGTANHTASIENIKVFNNDAVESVSLEDDFIDIHSACSSNKISKVEFSKNETYKYDFIEEDLLPSDFKSNYDRELSKMNKVIFTTGDIPLHAKFTGELFRIQDENEAYHIQFLE